MVLRTELADPKTEVTDLKRDLTSIKTGDKLSECFSGHCITTRL